MKERLNKTERNVLDNLDRMIAGKPPLPPSGFLEQKLMQTLKAFQSTEEKRAAEQNSTAQLMSDISHQIKTPIAALSLHLELARDETLTAEERAAELEECALLAEKIDFLSDAIFKVARLEAGLISVIRVNEDIVKTIMSALLTVKPAAEAKRLSLEYGTLPARLYIPHDPVWTREALINLLDNAIKYTNEGGVCVSLDPGAIFLRIDIADTGIGIFPEDYTKIFSRFYRVRQKDTERVAGTGLGLSIAREIMRQMGGNITVKSGTENDGKGSVFSLFLQNC